MKIQLWMNEDSSEWETFSEPNLITDHRVRPYDVDDQPMKLMYEFDTTSELKDVDPDSEWNLSDRILVRAIALAFQIGYHTGKFGDEPK